MSMSTPLLAPDRRERRSVFHSSNSFLVIFNAGDRTHLRRCLICGDAGEATIAPLGNHVAAAKKHAREVHP